MTTPQNMENLAFDPNYPFPKREDFTERETHLIMEAFEAGKRDERIGLTEKIKEKRKESSGPAKYDWDKVTIHETHGWNAALDAVKEMLTK